MLGLRPVLTGRGLLQQEREGGRQAAPTHQTGDKRMLTPENCGASQTACNIVNATFLSLDGFAAMRASMTPDYDALAFAGELARVTDREIRDSEKLTEDEALSYVYELMDESNYKASKKRRLWNYVRTLFESEQAVPRSLVRETFLEVDADLVNS